MIESPVEIDRHGNKYRFNNEEPSQLHCEHGPAIKNADGTKKWYLNGEELTEAEFNNRMTKTCSGKVVEVEGVKYKLVEVSNEA